MPSAADASLKNNLISSLLPLPFSLDFLSNYYFFVNFIMLASIVIKERDVSISYFPIL